MLNARMLKSHFHSIVEEKKKTKIIEHGAFCSFVASEQKVSSWILLSLKDQTVTLFVMMNPNLSLHSCMQHIENYVGNYVGKWPKEFTTHIIL